MPNGKPITRQQTKNRKDPQKAISDAIDILAGRRTSADAGTYKTYRQMMKHPTIALARATVVSPIIAGKWSFETKDAASEQMKQFITDQLEPRRHELIGQMLRALDFGWQPFEICCAQTAGRFGLTQIKPLLQDISTILASEDGTITGVKNGEVDLPIGKVLLFTLGAQPDNPYGESRLENIREHGWKMWTDCDESASRYDRKVAGVYMILHYLNQLIQIPGGADISPYEDANRMAQQLGAGKMILSPEYPGNDENGESKPHYRIEMVEDKGGRQGQFLERLRYADELMFRGFLRPERSGLSASKGGIGTSDTEDMQDLALTDGEMLSHDIADAINKQIVDPLLMLNAGPQAKGSVYITPAPMVDRKVGIFADFIKLVAGAPGGIDWLAMKCNIDAMLDAIGIPRDESMPDLPFPVQEPPIDEPTAPPGQPPVPPKQPPEPKPTQLSRRKRKG